MHFRHLDGPDCVREFIGQHEMPLSRVRKGDRSGSAGTEILSENLEEHSRHLGDNAGKGWTNPIVGQTKESVDQYR